MKFRLIFKGIYDFSGTVNVNTNAQIRIYGNTAITGGGAGVVINCGAMTVSTTAGIIGTGFGFLGNQGPGKGTSNSHGAGAGHGGSEIRDYIS